MQNRALLFVVSLLGINEERFWWWIYVVMILLLLCLEYVSSYKWRFMKGDESGRGQFGFFQAISTCDDNKS